MLVAAHRLSELRGCVDRVVTLSGGRVVADLPAAATGPDRRVVLTLRGVPEDVEALASRIPEEAGVACRVDGSLRLVVPEDRLIAVCAALQGPGVDRCRVEAGVEEGETR